MADTATKLPVRTGKEPQASSLRDWRPFGGLRREIDRLFEDFDQGFMTFPYRQSLYDLEPRWLRETAPAVDITEKDNAYEIAAELPGMDQNNIEVNLKNGVLTIRGKRSRRRKRRTRTTTSRSVVMALSSARSKCPRASTPRRSKPRSTRAC
jgi:HSP20 family protein